MTDSDVQLIIGRIDALERVITHSNITTDERLTRLEHAVAAEAQRVTRLEGRVDADIQAREADEAGGTRRTGFFVHFASGATVACLSSVLTYILSH